MDISVQQHLLPPVVLLAMLSVGMELKISQFHDLLARPRIPLLGTLIHTLSFPLLAGALILAILYFDINASDATKAGILLIAACPSGGFSNVLVLIARANLPLSVLLTTVSSLMAFITVPLLISASSAILSDLDQPVRLPVAATLQQLLVLVVIPVGVGMLVRHRWPANTVRLQPPLQKGSQILLYLCVGAMVMQDYAIVAAHAADALPWSLVLCIANLWLCYQAAKWCGFNPEDRVTVALEGSIRNLAVALLIALNVLERPDIAVLPTVYFIAVLLVAIAFALGWRRLLP